MAETPAFSHDAFISYSRKDTPFAAALERALKRYRPPKGLAAPQRRLNVFRDQEDFTGVEYNDAVARHLRGSRKLIIVCSPHARQSRYVNDEIRVFAEAHDADAIVPVIISGVPNNELPSARVQSAGAQSGAGDEAAFPDALCELLAVPLASDFRGFVPAWWRSLGSGRFRGAWYKLLADILGCSRAEVEQRERRRRKRQRIIWGTATATIALLLGAALYETSIRGRTSRSNELAVQALNIVRSDPELATLLSLEAAKQMDTPAAVSALRVALAEMPDLQMAVTPGADYSTPREISFSPGGQQMAIADGRSSPRIIDIPSAAGTGTGTGLAEGLGKGAGAASRAATNVRWSPDGSLLAIIDTKPHSIILDAATGRRIAETDGEVYWQASPGAAAPSGDGTRAVPAVIRGARTLRSVELDRHGSWRTINDLPNPGASRNPGVREGEDAPAGILSPDARRFATLAEDTHVLTVLDLDTGRTTTRVIDGPADLGFFWSPKSTYIVTHSLNGFIVLDAHSLATMWRTDTGDQISVEDLTVSADETLLAGTDRGGNTTVWHITSKKVVATLVGQEARAYRPVFAANNTLVGIVYSNGRAELFDLGDAASGRTAVVEGEEPRRTPLTTFDASAGEIITMDFTPDARMVIVQYVNGPVAMWSTDRWRPVSVSAFDRATAPQPLPQGPAKPSQLHRLPHEAQVMSETSSADGACILTASAYRMASGGAPANANVVRLWDSGSARMLRQWHFDGLGPDTAFFTGRDRIVAVFEGKAYVYHTPLCEPIDVLRDLASRRVSRDFTPEERSTYLGERAPATPLRADAPAVAAPTPSAAAPAVAVTESASAPKAAPAFDCARASTPVETLICNDAALARLDVDLTRAYRAAREPLQGAARQRLTADQHAWIKSRAACARETDMRACVEAAYHQRLAALRP